MENSVFGKTGVNVSKLGLGLAQVGFQLGSAEYDTADKILNTALDNGINFLDTAAMYLDSESIVGKSVGHRRDEYFLATKAGTGRTTSPDSEWTYKKMKDSVENSLKDLQTDVIDLVQLHSCETHLLEQGDVIKALQDCKLEGKIKYIGYSGDNEAAMWAVKSNLFDTLLSVLPEFSSINDLTSALLIPLSFPVTRNDWPFNNPLFSFTKAFFIFSKLPNSFKTLILISFAKKLFIELT